MRQRSYRFAVLLVGSLLLAGCGGRSMLAPATNRLASVAAVQAVPPSSAFVTVQANVTQLLPDTHNPNNNLDHQNFVVVTTSGQTLTCNNDISAGIGTKVPNLAVGEALTIRGVEYQDPGAAGIHWTHHNVTPGDAGFVKTPDGNVYQ